MISFLISMLVVMVCISVLAGIVGFLFPNEDGFAERISNAIGFGVTALTVSPLIAPPVIIVINFFR